MAEITPIKESPLREVQIEALVAMRIIKHATATFPIPATGFLVGMDVGSQLQITNTFQFPTAALEASSSQDSYHQADPATIAAAAPRAKSNVAYQNEMIKFLREVNVDAQGVGWYMSANMGNFVNSNFIENQHFYQRAADEKTVALVFDASRSSQGSLSLKAYRLSTAFMAAFKEGKFTTET
jgi:translation initiation factor 3 subunit H